MPTAGNFRAGPERGVSYTRSRSRDSGDGGMRLREMPSTQSIETANSEAHRRHNEPQLQGKSTVKGTGAIKSLEEKRKWVDAREKNSSHMPTAGNFRAGQKRGVSYTRSRSRDSGDEGMRLREMPSTLSSETADSEAHRRRNEPQLQGKPTVDAREKIMAPPTPHLPVSHAPIPTQPRPDRI
ncbi:unnamed protein product [Caenorhabditis nigoni]